MSSANCENAKITIGAAEMDYVAFGSGTQSLIILPGLSDGLVTVEGKAAMMSRYFGVFSKDFRVYIFSRKRPLEKGCTTKDMAADQKKAMELLGIEKANVMGISQGGMIVQHIAIDYPEVVNKLVLAVTVSRQNSTVQNAVSGWIKMAEENDYGSIIADTMEKTYSPKKLKTFKLMSPVIKRMGKPKSFDRFIIQANACLKHDAYDGLEKIKCPTLILGGGEDQVVGEKASPEMAEKIKNSKLIIYEGLGHGAHEETKDFNQKILDFLL